MIEVTPKVYLLAETKLHAGGVNDWLEELDGLEVVDHLTGTDPESLIELAARRCYKSFRPGLNPNVTKVRENSREYHKHILSSRHGRVLEHATCTFAFEYVSRVFTHELVRNCVGTTYAQESLRYVRLTWVSVYRSALQTIRMRCRCFGLQRLCWRVNRSSWPTFFRLTR